MAVIGDHSDLLLPPNTNGGAQCVAYYCYNAIVLQIFVCKLNAQSQYSALIFSNDSNDLTFDHSPTILCHPTSATDEAQMLLDRVKGGEGTHAVVVILGF